MRISDASKIDLYLLLPSFRLLCLNERVYYLTSLLCFLKISNRPCQTSAKKVILSFLYRIRVYSNWETYIMITDLQNKLVCIVYYWHIFRFYGILLETIFATSLSFLVLRTPYCTTFSYWQKRISTTLQRYNAKALQQSQYKIARTTGLLHEDHNDLNNTILNDRHIYDVVV
jgi:hypothetical protein